MTAYINSPIMLKLCQKSHSVGAGHNEERLDTMINRADDAINGPISRTICQTEAEIGSRDMGGNSITGRGMDIIASPHQKSYAHPCRT